MGQASISSHFTLSLPHSSPKAIQETHTSPHSFFKTLIDHEVTVELKNDIQIRGVLKSVDQYLNIKHDNIPVGTERKHPPLVRPHSPFTSCSKCIHMC